MVDEAQAVQDLIAQASKMATLKAPGAKGEPSVTPQGGEDKGPEASGEEGEGSSPPADETKEKSEEAKPTSEAPPATSESPTKPTEIRYVYKGKEFVEADPEKIRNLVQMGRDYSEKMAEVRRTKESPDWQTFQELRSEAAANPAFAAALRTVLTRSDDKKFLSSILSGPDAEAETPPTDEEPAPVEKEIKSTKSRLDRLERAEEERTKAAKANAIAQTITGALGAHRAFANPTTRQLVARHIAVAVTRGEIEESDIPVEAARLASELEGGAKPPTGQKPRTPHTPEPGAGAAATVEPPGKLILGQNTEGAAARYLERLAGKT